MRYLFLLVFASVAFGQPVPRMFELDASGVVISWADGKLTPHPGNTTVTLMPADMTEATTSEENLTRTPFRYVAGKIVLREPADLALERKTTALAKLKAAPASVHTTASP